MSIRFLGGIITNNATQPTSSVAKGIWTLSQQSQAKYANAWPTGIPLDAQFNYVTALLNGDGTNGAQNNTFVDSSSNNFTITRYGNTTQGSFSPYGPNWSNYFDGGTNRLTTATSSLFNLSGTNITLECWVYMTAAPSVVNRLISIGPNDVQSSLVFAINPTRVFDVGVPFGSGGAVNSGASTIPLNTWTHLAFVLSGSTGTIYINGTQVGQTTGWNITSTTSNYFYLGYDTTGTVDGKFTGYVSNARLVIGTAVYTANFTPPTSALTAISGTRLLTCQSNRFIDTSSNAFAITVNGSPRVQRFNPFGTASPYSTIVNGGSGYFDAVGDGLSVPSSTGFQFGSGDFTVECWVYLNANGISGTAFLGPWATPAGSNRGWIFAYVNSGTTLLFNYSVSGTDTVSASTTYPLSLKTWYHLAAVRNGSTIKLYVNGVLVSTTAISSSIYATTNNLYIGQNTEDGTLPTTTNNFALNGYITNVRVVKGTAVYTANFTPPTSPLTAIAGTQLLVNTVNAGIYDSAMMNDYETIDNTQLSTAVKKFGTASIYFDGTTDTLSSPSQPIYNFGTGNFTIEMWVNRAGAGTGDRFLVSRSNGADFLFRWTAGGVLQFHIASAVIAAYTWAFTTGTWYHLAAVRNGSTVTIYIDGTSVATGTNSTNMSSTAPLLIGGYPPTSSDYFNGYIDDLRITNGVARYTANFTPPTAAFPTAGP